MENFTDPLTPLTQDLMMLEAPPGVRFIRGWLYTQLRPWQIILPFRAPDHVLARLFTELGAKTPDLPLNYWKVPFTLAVFFMLWAVSAVLFQRTENMPDDFMDIYRDLCRRVARDSRSGPAATLRRLWSWSFRRFFEPVGQMAVLVNLSSGRYMFGRVVLQKLLARWAPNLGGEAVALLCSGTQGVLSAEMGKDIRRLAALARSREGVRILFETHGLDTLTPALEAAPEAAGFLKELGRFLDQYGHRALKELELRSIRWEEDSTPVLGMIRNYVLWQVDSGRPEEEIQRTRKKLEADLFAALDEHPLEKTFGIRRRAVSALARWIRYYTKLRENSRFYHVMGLGVVRKKVLAIEKGLLDRGRLKCKDDIFFLHLDEIRRLQQGEWGWRDVEERIRERRMEHIRLAKTAPPRTIGIDLPEPAGPGPASDGRIIRGQGASPGRYEGVAHVILDPSLDLALKPGEVLVAPYTDPAWTPLFLTAGAAVVEVGSYLSHAGTVAREFGMPCVVDAVDSTKRIRTGQRLVVNGDQGWVQLVDPENGGPA
jgi:phosphohistidine swiveling domain-containing protein